MNESFSSTGKENLAIRIQKAAYKLAFLTEAVSDAFTSQVSPSENAAKGFDLLAREAIDSLFDCVVDARSQKG